MSAETALRALLAADSATAALVSTRIAADRIEQGATRPFVVFTRVATENEYGLNGTLHAAKCVFDVQCWGDTRVSVQAVADAVQAALEADYRAVTARANGYDGELDLEAVTLSVDWWD